MKRNICICMKKANCWAEPLQRQVCGYLRGRVRQSLVILPCLSIQNSSRMMVVIIIIENLYVITQV